MEAFKNGTAQVTIPDKTANPGPLGLLGFGLTTFLLNLCNAGAFPLDSMILAMAFCYGGLAQIVAGIMEWKRGNLFPFLAFVSYGFFWWSLFFVVTLPGMGIAKAPDDTSMGCYLFIWGIFSFIMFVATLIKRAPISFSFLFLTVVVLFMLLAGFHWTNNPRTLKTAGVEGIICGLTAIYIAAGELLNGFAGRTVLPLFERPPKV